MNEKIGPAEIKAGDVLISKDGIEPMWVAQSAAKIRRTLTTVEVMHIPDGGIDVRSWDTDTTSRYYVIDVTDGAMEKIRQDCSYSLVVPTRVIRLGRVY